VCLHVLSGLLLELHLACFFLHRLWVCLLDGTAVTEALQCRPLAAWNAKARMQRHPQQRGSHTTSCLPRCRCPCCCCCLFYRLWACRFGYTAVADVRKRIRQLLPQLPYTAQREVWTPKYAFIPAALEVLM
jgi:hypothetical protein